MGEHVVATMGKRPRYPPMVRAVFDIVKALPSVDVFSDDAELDAYLARIFRPSA